MARYRSVDEYVASLPDEVRQTLEAVRRTIREAAPPAAEEGISYGIPALRVDGRFFIWFAGWKRSVSLYPVPAHDAGLSADLAPYLAGKGTLKFPLDRPIPYVLVGRVTAELGRERLAGER
ncbi:MAG TPA: DUF1801 domain-containing protein [Candidatus Limnocylindrales bacterium]